MTAYETEAMPSERISSAADLRDRLVPPIPGSVLWGWLGPLLVTAFGTFLRFDPGTTRCPVAGPHGMTFLGIGARRGSYEPRGPF